MGARGLLAVCCFGAALACAAPREGVPSVLLGRWHSEDPAYAERALSISRNALVFASSATRSESFAIRGVETHKESDGSLGVSIAYGTRAQDLTLRVRRYATDPPSLKIGERPERWVLAATGAARP